MQSNSNVIAPPLVDFLEFVVFTEFKGSEDLKENHYSLALLKVSTINLVEAVNHSFSLVHTDNGRVFKVSGNYRQVTNRIYYARQRNKIINMAILKPSDYFYHKLEKIDDAVDNIFYSQETLDILKGILLSDLFTYRGIQSFDS